MKKEKIKELVAEYDENYELYKLYTKKTRNAIEELLEEENIKIHSISSRVKEKSSFKEKLNKSEDDEYKVLSDITDISGIRIITIFEDEVDEVAEIIKQEFEIDYENSVDKRNLLDPDRFGYLSLHYIVKSSSERLDLPEAKGSKICKAEIQIRSILQHAWAEIEHDLGYKSEITVPREIRRNFSRLAGLLEIADNEFVKTRDDLKEYEEKISEKIAKEPASVYIDQTSLKTYIEHNNLVKKLDEEIAKLHKAELSDSSNDYYIKSLIEKLNYLNIETINEIKELLNEKYELLLEFVARFRAIRNKLIKDKASLNPGIAIFYLCYLIASKNKSVAEVLRYLEQNSFRNLDKKERLAEEIVNIYKEL